MFDKKWQEIKLKPKQFLVGRIDSRLKLLPSEIIFKGVGDFELYIDFNKTPTMNKYQTKLTKETNMIISNRFQKLLTSDFSIRFKLFALNELEGKIKNVFKGNKKIKSYHSTSKNFNILDYPFNDLNNDQYCDLNMKFPKNFDPNSKRPDNIIQKNIESAFCFRRRKRGHVAKKRNEVYFKKITKVFEKKNTIYQEKIDKILQNKDKFIKLKNKVIFIFKILEI